MDDVTGKEWRLGVVVYFNWPKYPEAQRRILLKLFTDHDNRAGITGLFVRTDDPNNMHYRGDKKLMHVHLEKWIDRVFVLIPQNGGAISSV